MQKPTVEQILQFARHDQQYWAPRNERMRRHHALYRIRRKRAPEGQMLIYGNEPKVLIEKLTGTTARREHRIEVPPKGEPNADAAQRIENGLRWWRTSIRRDWQRGLHNPLDYDEALSLFLRGWLVERMMLALRTESFVDVTLFEPANVFPWVTGKHIARVEHVYYATKDDIQADFPDVNLGEYDDPEQKLRVIAYYQNKEPYWHAVLVEDEFVKPPTELGYWPWLLQVAKGSFSHHLRGWEDDDLVPEEIGMGFLDAVEDAYRDKNMLVTMLANAVAKQENPPAVLHTQDGQVKEVSLDAGGRTTLMIDEKVTMQDVAPKIATMMPLLTSIQDQINKGGLPAVMFGEGANLASGFMGAVMQSAAEDVLWTYVKALETFKMARYEKFLELYRDWGDRALPIMSMTKLGAGAGKYVWGDELTVQDVVANGTFVDVIYEDIAPRDRVALANIAAMLVKEKVIDLATARDKYLGLDDPGLINDKVLADMVYLNDEVVKILSKLKLAELNKVPELAALLQAEREAQALADAKAQQSVMQQQSAMQQGIGPTGEQGQMSPEVLPGVMQTGQTPDQDPMMAALMGAVRQP